MTDITTLVWLDVETTGLNPREGQLLQVACILTDLLGNEIAEPFERIVAYESRVVEFFKGTVDSFVVDMHTTTGLWERLSGPEALPLAEVEDDLLAYIAEHAPEARQAQFAGNSVRFDMNWSEVHLPKVYDHLHYRNIDITGLMTTFERFGLVNINRKPGFVGEKHNAVDDIRHAVKTYVWLYEDTRGDAS